jgi:hypothetical protein
MIVAPRGATSVVIAVSSQAGQVSQMACSQGDNLNTQGRGIGEQGDAIRGFGDHSAHDLDPQDEVDSRRP